MTIADADLDQGQNADELINYLQSVSQSTKNNTMTQNKFSNQEKKKFGRSVQPKQAEAYSEEENDPEFSQICHEDSLLSHSRSQIVLDLNTN